MASKPKPSRHAPEEVDAYLNALPDDIRSTLQAMRDIIRDVAPECTERVSYGIPIFRLGKDLISISAWKHHCSIHVMSTAIIEGMKDELKEVKVSGSTLRFTPDKPLPRDVLERLVRARMQHLITEAENHT